MAFQQLSLDNHFLNVAPPAASPAPLRPPSPKRTAAPPSVLPVWELATQAKKTKTTPTPAYRSIWSGVANTDEFGHASPMPPRRVSLPRKASFDLSLPPTELPVWKLADDAKPKPAVMEPAMPTWPGVAPLIDRRAPSMGEVTDQPQRSRRVEAINAEVTAEAATATPASAAAPVAAVRKLGAMRKPAASEPRGWQGISTETGAYEINAAPSPMPARRARASKEYVEEEEEANGKEKAATPAPAPAKKQAVDLSPLVAMAELSRALTPADP